jgi:hypothetical protein
MPQGRGSQTTAADYTQLGDALKTQKIIDDNAAKAKQRGFINKNGKFVNPNAVYKDAKGRVIHNWKALYGIKPRAKVATVTFEGINPGQYDMGTSGEYSWRV